MKPSIRRPPAYQEYASDVLANETFSDMTLAERGLWLTMRLQCWVNDSVPADPEGVARVLHLDHEAVKAAWTQRVMSFFAEHPERGDRLTCPELDTYRADMERRRQTKSEAGKKGAEARYSPPSSRLPSPQRGKDGAAGDPDDIPF